MGLIESNWKKENCPIEDGIFYPDDTYIALTGSPIKGYICSKRLSVSELIMRESDNWAQMDPNPNCEIIAGQFRIIAGGGSWEGEGFIAVLTVKTGKLWWLLHLTESEIFMSVEVEGDNLIAVSSEYPYQFQWIIPIAQPEKLKVLALSV